MLTLSYGYKKPETNDKGAIVFTALEDDIQQLNDHTHNGTNSSTLPPGSITRNTSTLGSGSWVSIGQGKFTQTVTLPASLQFDNVMIECRLLTGDVVYPTIRKSTATSFVVTFNDSALSLVVYYL